MLGRKTLFALRAVPAIFGLASFGYGVAMWNRFFVGYDGMTEKFLQSHMGARWLFTAPPLAEGIFQFSPMLILIGALLVLGAFAAAGRGWVALEASRGWLTVRCVAAILILGIFGLGTLLGLHGHSTGDYQAPLYWPIFLVWAGWHMIGLAFTSEVEFGKNEGDTEWADNPT